MKLTSRTEYALQALITLGERFETGITPIQAIADEQKIPKRFLEQILNDLRAGGFVESRRGVSGGYRLARPPKDILFSELLVLLENFPSPASPLPSSSPSSSPAENSQSAIQETVHKMLRALFHSIEPISLETLCSRSAELKSGQGNDTNYSI